MVSENSVQFYINFLKSHSIDIPKVHIVLGSGFGESLKRIPSTEFLKIAELSLKKIPNVSSTSVMDHSGEYHIYQNQKDKSYLQFQLGRLHGYEGHAPQEAIKPVLIPRLAGVPEFILTNAAGGISESMKPGDVMVLNDHVNFTGHNPLVGPNPSYNGQTLGPRFPDLSKMYKSERRALLLKALRKTSLGVHEGAYLGLLGPSFETPAEIRLFKHWGVSAVGMSTVWEAIALHHSGAKTSGISLISNLAAGLSPGEIDHQGVLQTCRQSAEQIIGAILETFKI